MLNSKEFWHLLWDWNKFLSCFPILSQTEGDSSRSRSGSSDTKFVSSVCGLTQEQNEILLLGYNLVLRVTGQDPYDQGLYSREVYYVHFAQKWSWQSTVYYLFEFYFQNWGFDREQR